jgi:hypothetical protein
MGGNESRQAFPCKYQALAVTWQTLARLGGHVALLEPSQPQAQGCCESAARSPPPIEGYIRRPDGACLSQ